MAYTTDAMISVLQKVYAVTLDKKPSGTFYPIQYDNNDENHCFVIAQHANYFTADHNSCIQVMHPTGLIELARLIEAKEQKAREEQLYLSNIASAKASVRSMYSSFVSTTILAFTLFVVCWNGCKPTILHHPVVVELLPSLTANQNTDPHTNHHNAPGNSQKNNTCPCNIP